MSQIKNDEQVHSHTLTACL